MKELGRKVSEQERELRNKAQRAEAQRMLQIFLAGVQRLDGLRGGDVGQPHGSSSLTTEGASVCFSAARQRHPRRRWVGPGKHSLEIRQKVLGASARMQVSR